MRRQGVAIPKDWFKEGSSKKSDKARVVHSFQQVNVTKSEELPELMTVSEVASFFKCHPKTVQDWISKRLLKSIKVMGRRFVTPEQIADFLDRQVQANG